MKGGKAGNNINIQSFTYNGGKGQLWKITQNKDGSFVFKSASNNKYAITLKGGVIAKRTNIQLNTYKGLKSQKWMLIG